MESTTLKGIVRYDGTNFSGWQTQTHCPSVQAAIEGAMSRIANQPVRIQGAGRTDAGVHALGQVFSCVWPGAAPTRLRHALSKMLSPEIQITSLEETAPGFNARFNAKSKRYAYTFDFGREPDPLAARYAWHVPYKVDLDLLRSLLPQLTGSHDFVAFQSAGNPRENTVRSIYDIKLVHGPVIGPCDNPQLWHVEYHGDGFLYRMVRNLSGTLIEIARGRFPAAFIGEQLQGPGPFIGHCAPPHGLALLRVNYENDLADPASRIND